MHFSSFLIVGLGNPGPRYASTHHNIGALSIAELLSRHPGTNLSVHRRTNTETADFFLSPGGPKAIIARTRTAMNLSGTPVAGLVDFFKIPLNHLVIIHDELELPFGDIKIRLGGGDHGHNGLKSVSRSLKSRDYVRVSIGIGRPPGRMDPAKFVLQPFNKNERAELPIICANAVDAVEDYLHGHS
ncbi:aminoacyl-tRNA hydrolase [Corynebacterium sp. 3HC-13]|uniref:aminoacyl-tRNA hydrolase n=1 Tax=Corynebacterium poyangense TaxID=2684405 RepID=UPI001CD02287|nr:aminoacyl-tRNA hydrolase [Corynebacterium poyangense]MBZ8176242.1 aminoacyl-tRNA hydrolase [Corynebacterium poyangense]